MIEMLKCDFVSQLRNIRLLSGLLSFMVIICSSSADAYQLLSSKWPQPTTTFYVNMAGADGQWNEAFESAMSYWGVDTSFSFTIVREVFEDPCDAWDGKNGVAFGATFCGDAWGGTTLAITQSWSSAGTTTQTDIIFNSNESWNVYSTPWHSSPWYGVSDFKRVAVHELGHALGLGHEDSGIATIMQTYAGDTIIPQQDDIDGVIALYGVPIADADGDGVPDSSDNCPTIVNGTQDDLDSDNIGNACDTCPNDQNNDSDSDGVCGDIDTCPVDPLKFADYGQCGCNNAEIDSDGDGTADCIDSCMNDPLKIIPGVCGCSIADTDSDNDGVEDCNDTCPAGDDTIDSDGDNLPDACDSCPSDSEKEVPGNCGCGITEVFTDANDDGIFDCLDEKDYDLDGFSDKQEIECGSDPAAPASRCGGSVVPSIMLLLRE